MYYSLVRAVSVTILFVCILSSPLHAQSVQVPDSVDGGWNVDLAGKLSGSQAAYRNWQEGGLNTLALTSTLDGRVEYETDHWVQAYNMRWSFGIIQQDTLAIRKAEDLIRMEGALRYKGNGFFRVFNPTIALGLRTQFAAGFNYDKDPFNEGRDVPVKTSDLFSPATLTQSLGLTFGRGGWFSQRLSAASKETVVLIDRLRPLYDVDPTRSVLYEIGVESVTAVNREVFTNVQVQSTLTLFMAVVEPEPVDVIWETLVTMRVNSWLNVGFEWVNIYDANRSTAVQIKEVLSVGISFEII
jgi:hypothetical protein